MKKWGTVRVLNAVILDVKDAVERTDGFSNIADFVEYAIRKELDGLAGVSNR